MIIFIPYQNGILLGVSPRINPIQFAVGLCPDISQLHLVKGWWNYAAYLGYIPHIFELFVGWTNLLHPFTVSLNFWSQHVMFFPIDSQDVQAPQDIKPRIFEIPGTEHLQPLADFSWIRWSVWRVSLNLKTPWRCAECHGHRGNWCNILWLIHY